MVLNRKSHPCVNIGVLADAWLEEVMKVVGKVLTNDVETDVVIGTISGVYVESDIGVGILSDINDSVLVVAMASL